MSDVRPASSCPQTTDAERGDVVTVTKVSPDNLVWWGEDGEWIAAPGHLDLAEFTEAADALARRDVDADMADDELPSAADDASHTWFRPMTREWFDQHVTWGDADQRDSHFASLTAEGALEPCGPDAR